MSDAVTINPVEPVITMNGVPLTLAQAMTVRVAIEGFSMDLMNTGLGDDEHGKTMVKLYMQRIEEIRRVMYANNPHYIR